MMKSIVVKTLAAAIALTAGAAGAQESYPSKPVRLVVPFATGSGIDQVARIFAEELRVLLKQPVIVETREGAAGVIGATSVAAGAADGYTVLVSAHPPFAIAPQLQKNAGYDPAASFTPIARVGAVVMVGVSASSNPFKNWQEMSAYFRANPDKANYAVSGTGSPGQLFTQLIKLQTGLPMQEISYKSTGQALNDAVGGQVQFSIVSMAAALGHIKGGTLRLMGVGSKDRLKDFPGTPTLGELIGDPSFEALVWYGFLVPRATPAAIVNRLYAEIAMASTAPRVVDLFTKASVLPGLQNPQQFADSLRNDAAMARRMIDAAKLQPQ